MAQLRLTRPQTKRRARRRRGPLFVFLTWATVAALLGHGAQRALAARPPAAQWKASTPDELVLEIGPNGEARLALNAQR